MIIQNTTWICENCEYMETITSEVFPYDDPVIAEPSEGWGYLVMGNCEVMACPKCNKRDAQTARLVAGVSDKGDKIDWFWVFENCKNGGYIVTDTAGEKR